MLASYLFLFYSLRRVQTITAFHILSIAYYLQAFLSRLQSVLFFYFVKNWLGFKRQIRSSTVLFLFCFHHRYVYLKAAIKHLKHIQPD